MKTSRIPAGSTVLFVLIGLGFVPAENAHAATTPSEQDQTKKEKEFLSDPNVAVGELETTTIDSLDFIKRRPPSFVRRMQRANKQDIKRAEITVDGRRFKILLGERPEREFYLFDVETNRGPYWWGSWSLHSYHKIGEKFYEFMLVEDGTKIAGRPFKGELGTIKVGKGGRELEKTEFNGSVHQAANVGAPIGKIEEYWTGEVPECRIPVGDYTSYLMQVTYDNLAIDISNNYHTDAKGRPRGKRRVIYGMNVRKDEPYVLDFSNEPMVVFDQPPKSKTSFKRGEEIKFAAVLIDPELDIMIRGLDDTSVKVEKKTSSGHKYTRSKSLDPKVVITRAGGEVVAEGVMPFG